MDSFTEKMLERAKARQKKIDEHYNIAGETPKKPLQETNSLINKLENVNNFTKSQPNLSENERIICKKDIASDSDIFKKTLHNTNFKENYSDSNLNRYSRQGSTKISSENSPKSPTKTLNIQQDNFNMEIKLTSTDNVRVEVEIEERDENDDDMEDTNVAGICKIIHKDKETEVKDKGLIREDAKKRLQRLGKLYSGVEDPNLSSPIHRTENKFEDETVEKEIPKVSCGLGKLKALANTVKEWEDELPNPGSKVTKKETPKKNLKPPAPKPPVVLSQNSTPKLKYPAPKPPNNVHAFTKIPSRETSPEKYSSTNKSPDKKSTSKTPNEEKSKTKLLSWDQAVIETLESQGFTRTNSNARLVYKYKENESDESHKKNINSDSKSEILETEEEEELNEEVKENETILPSKMVSKLALKFNEESKSEEKPNFKPRSPTKCGEISNKVAMFEQQAISPSKKDPALLSVSERKALFEKNKGAALIPKAAFAMSAPMKSTEKENTKAAVKPSSPVKLNPKSKITSPVKSVIAQPKASSQIKSSKKLDEADSPAKASIKQSGGIASKVRALLEKKSTISQTQIVSGVKEQRQKEMDLLLNRFSKQKEDEDDEDVESHESEEEIDEESVSETTKMIPDKAVKIVQFKGSNAELSTPPPPPPLPIAKTSANKRRSKGDSPKVRQVLEDVKRIRVSPPKAGKMYPNLSDIEAGTETEQEHSTAEPSPESSFEGNSSNAESDGPNTSFGREIMEVVCKNQTPNKRPILDESTASDISSFLDEMDNYLDDVVGSESGCEGPTPPKQGKQGHTPQLRTLATPSNSFHYKNFSKNNSSTINDVETDESSNDHPTHIVEEGNVLPLTHSVSFYRKQQAQQNSTPVRKILRPPSTDETTPTIKEESIADEKLEVQNKIQELLEFVGKQQTVISQASQALNLCVSTVEFSGSSEQVEAERLLLVATQRRQAALHEVQRLRVEGTLHPGGGICFEKGTLTISDICFPLKKEYARALSATGGLGHHVMCLVRYAEQVIPTRIASTQASPRDNLEMFLDIPGTVKLQDVYSDFTATLEVYTLQAHEELLPHEVKYHISSKKNSSKLTPKKIKESKLIMPSVQSPAGPQAVRSPSFQLMGYVVFSLAGISRTQWALNNTPSMSPLEGNMQMKIKCELSVSVEHRGFLSMFDDVSGFGAWHRRWCLLKGNHISYWKYPDDEKKKAPIDSINLQVCSTKQVSQVTREICARPHTFLLETVRPSRSTDTDSLVTVCKGDKTIIRHLLSADTKEERVEWCDALNKALRLIRLIGNSSKV